MIYLLLEDKAALDEQISTLHNKIKGIGKEMGESCREGAETFHDNFAYEDGERQLVMWTRRFNELCRIRDEVAVFSPDGAIETVSIGRIVILQERGDSSQQRFEIAGHFLFANKEIKRISCASPLARIILGARIDEIRTGIIAGQERSFKIVEIK